MGTTKDVKAFIHVIPDASPVFYKTKAISYLMRTKVLLSHDSLQSANIIELVTNSQWATPIVPMLKYDGTVHICNDYKVTVNMFAHIEQYPLPTQEDMFATLAGGVMFSKLDMTYVYQQILIDNDSKQYLTINTHLRFLPNLATIRQPFHQLLKKGHVFRWGTAQERAFNMTKALIGKAPVLTHYDVNKPFLLTCNILCCRCYTGTSNRG